MNQSIFKFRKCSIDDLLRILLKEGLQNQCFLTNIEFSLVFVGRLTIRWFLPYNTSCFS